jgi:outer membrane protein
MNRIVIALILLISSTAFAAPPPKIGVVDLQRAVSESKAGAAERAKILKKTEQINAELKLRLADIEKLRAEFEREASKFTQEARLEKERLIQKKSRDLQNLQRESQEEIKQIEADSLNKILNRLGGILGRLGDEGGYAIILEKGGGTAYFSKQVDVTPLLIKMSDEEDDRARK